jgi:hypothetical protein
MSKNSARNQALREIPLEIPPQIEIFGMQLSLFVEFFAFI